MSNKHNKLRKFHIWMPDIFDFKGGIQVFSEFLLRAMQSVEDEAIFEIFLKNDRSRLSKLPCSDRTHFHFAGQWPVFIRTAIFVTQILLLGFWNRPDLVITSHLHFAIIAYWLKRLIGTPYWVVAHGVEAWNIKDQRKKIALQKADKILAVSSYTRSRLIEEQGLDTSRVTILHNTVDSERFKIGPKPHYLLERYRLLEDQPIILTVSRLVRSEQYKGYAHILAALPVIRQALPNVHYIIAGKGDDSSRIEQMIAELNIEDCVTLAGFVPNSELVDYYNLCDLFAMPSKREGFGIVYLEALACGKPTLAGNKDGAVDALLHGQLGALVDPDDVTEIAQTIIQILNRTYPHSLMYERNSLREKALSVFGFDKFQQTLESCLQDHFRS